MDSFKRPQSLSEVARLSDTEQALSFNIRDFLDDFYADPRAERIAEEPIPLTATLKDNGLADAYLAGIAEYLSTTFYFKIPLWVRKPTRFLKDPFFAMKSFGGRMLLLIESPTAFRERNIFISADALNRA